LPRWQLTAQGNPVTARPAPIQEIPARTSFLYYAKLAHTCVSDISRFEQSWIAEKGD